MADETPDHNLRLATLTYWYC